MRTLSFSLLIAATLAGCATLTVSSHIERGVNFGEYLTYDWGPPDNLPVGDPRLDNNPFFRDRLQGAIEKWMAFKGYDRAVSGQPDLLVHYHANVNQKVDVYEADHAYGYCYGDCTDRVVEFEQGTLVVDVVDSRTHKVIWRGWAQGTMSGVIDNQQRLDEQVTKNVEKMMALLPQGGTAGR
jgi:Domain of unknown function (DUF4136)